MPDLLRKTGTEALLFGVDFTHTHTHTHRRTDHALLSSLTVGGLRSVDFNLPLCSIVSLH